MEEIYFENRKNAQKRIKRISILVPISQSRHRKAINSVESREIFLMPTKCECLKIVISQIRNRVSESDAIIINNIVRMSLATLDSALADLLILMLGTMKRHRQGKTTKMASQILYIAFDYLFLFIYCP